MMVSERDDREWRIRRAHAADPTDRFLVGLLGEGWDVSGLTEDEELFGLEVVPKARLEKAQRVHIEQQAAMLEALVESQDLLVEHDKLAAQERAHRGRVIDDVARRLGESEAREEKLESERDEAEQALPPGDHVVVHESRLYGAERQNAALIEALREARSVLSGAQIAAQNGVPWADRRIDIVMDRIEATLADLEGFNV